MQKKNLHKEKIRFFKMIKSLYTINNLFVVIESLLAYFPMV